jgi:hypothetical protein
MLDSILTYDAYDPQAKAKHKGILTMIVMDRKPFYIVNDPGFLKLLQLDPICFIHVSWTKPTFLRKKRCRRDHKKQTLVQSLFNWMVGVSIILGFVLITSQRVGGEPDCV